ncbi:maleylpyruvate isomerase N-terminal domain-containing protein [Hymenobacter jejuensis]|uniref:Maleylpyruvate isomerase family protein n=1 Tax=Hymenobacter jejuensis TaxID=2502781 RepID=A0A5B8A3J9_9BACT|nr:maleylpyruvate isomerase N-terminal domain-containing protein [Hymenobacter jejuensis]QDA62014.1 maleylpyruvate isomerase family protein [Hymenobacter jejuensis]
MTALAPLHTIHLFPVLDQHLGELLRSLTPADWERPTVAPKWRVRDVALHLLDVNLRTLSMLRDGHYGSPGPSGDSYAEIVAYLNRLNAEWVTVGQRLSPQVITWLLELSGPTCHTFLSQLDPLAPATFAVGWAGDTVSPNWFHIARDYTEKWHHQQQIRKAVGQEAPLLQAELYQPFLATSVRALPHHYRHVAAELGQVVQVTITGSGGDTWYLNQEATGWSLTQESAGEVVTEITLEGAVAWRLFTKSLPRPQAQRHIQIAGEQRLGEPIFELLAVMA